MLEGAVVGLLEGVRLAPPVESLAANGQLRTHHWLSSRKRYEGQECLILVRRVMNMTSRLVALHAIQLPDTTEQVVRGSRNFAALRQ